MGRKLASSTVWRILKDAGIDPVPLCKGRHRRPRSNRPPCPGRPSPPSACSRSASYLFRTVHPKDRGPYTPAEAAAAINAAAGDRVVSGTYLWLLRTGKRDNPTMKHLIAIARFFAVPPTYFCPDDSLGENAVPAELTATLGGESLGVRSTVVGFRVVGVHTVEEFPDRPLGPEHVKGHMLTVLRNDFVFALRL
jgi:hypothetical protein